MKRKTIPAILIITVIIITVCALFGCTPAAMDDVTGTYRLTVKTRQHVDAETATDYITENEIAEYLVITGNETGYRYYADKFGDPVCTEIKIEYDYSEDDKDKIDTVNIDYRSSNDLLYINYDKSTKKTSLVFDRNGIHSDLFYEFNFTVHTKYEKISDAKDLSVINSETGKTLNAVPYDFIPINGLCELNAESDPEGLFPYIYRYYDIDLNAGTAEIIYAEKADKIKKTETVSISYDTQNKIITIGTEVYNLTDNGFSREVVNPDSGTTLKYNLYGIGYIENMEEHTDNLIAEYSVIE